MKYFAYHEWDEFEDDVQVVLSVRQIVRQQFIYAERLYKRYSSAERAISDFVVGNWAYECNKDGTRRKNFNVKT